MPVKLDPKHQRGDELFQAFVRAAEELHDFLAFEIDTEDHPLHGQGRLQENGLRCSGLPARRRQLAVGRWC